MAKRGPKQLPRAERFWRKADRVDTGCWLWTGTTAYKRGGYGTFYDDDGRLRRAPRVAWELTHGPIPPGLVVRHSCDTPLCVCPAHLLLGTQADNLRDMTERQRGRGGTEHGVARYNHVLNDDLVAQSRAARAIGGPAAVAVLAVQAGVRVETLQKAARGETWRHV